MNNLALFRYAEHHTRKTMLQHSNAPHDGRHNFFVRFQRVLIAGIVGDPLFAFLRAELDLKENPVLAIHPGDTGAEAFREVSLYNDAWVEDKIKRYAAVMNGTRVLHQMANVSQCGKCEFVSACYGVRDDDDGDDGRVEPLLCDDGFSDSAPGWSVGRIGF